MGCLMGSVMRRFGPVLLLLLAALALAPRSAAADKAVPFLSGRVVDEAGMLPEDARQRIEGKLAAFEQKSGIQVAVLTISSLEGDPLEDYSMRVAQTWKLGQKGKDNGVLFLIAKDDRKMRIEVGYGLEGQLTDIQTGRIVDNVVRPDFQKGDFGAGIEHGTDAILTALGGGAVPAAPPEPPAEERRAPSGTILIMAVMLAAFSLMALSLPGCQSWFLYVFLMPFYLMLSSMFLPSGLIGVIAWAVVFPILKLLFFRSGFGRGFGGYGGRRGGPWGGFWGGGFGGGGFGGGGFGGGGGGFSGGGGSFGGGGASGSW